MSEIYCKKCYGETTLSGKADNGKQRYKCKECGFRSVNQITQDSPVDDITDIIFDETSIINTGNLDEIVEQNVKLAKLLQRVRDVNRVERKSFREGARTDNALLEYNKELVEVLSKNKLSKLTKRHTISKKKQPPAGIIHLTDVHFNELVHLVEKGGNRYDFNVAAKRLQLLVDTAKLYFNSQGIKNVLLALTGDLMNSDRRTDELLNMATNRSRATFLAVDILQQLVLDLNKDYNLTIANVTGNESRIRQHHEFSEMVASDNYDWTIFNMLKLVFKNAKGISFVEGMAREVVVDVNGQNILLMHGEQFGSQTERKVQNVIGKYSSKGVKIDMVLFGHMHSTKIGDFFARGSSLVGSNDYSDKGLQLSSKASQNIHIVYDNKRLDSIKVDLQEVCRIEGYDIDDSLAAYNPKSSEKLIPKTTIVKVVV
jgi:predicted phosphodiesterase